jgi:hypothetical protein
LILILDRGCIVGKLGFQLGGFRNAFTRSVVFEQGVLRRSL